MVITVFWMPSWSVLIISVGILCVAAVFLVCCICLQKKRTDNLKFGIQCNNKPKILNLSNNSLDKLITFRRFGQSKDEVCGGEFTSANLPICNKQESELLESLDFSERFSSSQLKFNGPEDVNHEEIKSCGSADSGYTFYSTYPMMAKSGSDSDTETYKSNKSSKKSLHSVNKSTSNLFVV